MSQPPKCERIIPYNDTTAVIPGYEGIPQNLLINSVCWILLLLLFSILRRVAWDYGRIAMRKTRQSRFSIPTLWASIFYSDIRIRSTMSDEVETLYPVHEYGFCSWLRSCFTLKTSDIHRKAGTDAVQYLRFQLYLIVYTGVTMVFCLGVILPLNMHGDLKSPNLQSFGVTTISNISANSAMLWGHVVLSILFVIFAFTLMHHFAQNLKVSMKPTLSHSTLMISGISRSNCHPELIVNHFEEAFPNIEVKDVQVCFDVRRLIKLDTEWANCKIALHQSRKQLELTGIRPVAVPRTCGWCCYQCKVGCRCDRGTAAERDDESQTAGGTCCACCCPDPVDAIAFHEEQVCRLKALVEEETKTAVKRKIGIAFVTFTSPEAAKRVCTAYRHSCFGLLAPPASRLSGQLRSRRWTVDFAPTPNNIIWMNLSLTRTLWWIKAICINIAIFLLVFFLTTPTYVLNLINKLRVTEYLHINNSFVAQFIPSIILWAVSALLPLLVYYSDFWLGYWTRSEMHFSIMIKTFTLLILMVLILPSLGLTSAPALLNWLFPHMQLVPLGPSTDSTAASTTVSASALSRDGAPPIPFIPIGPQSVQLECIFMPDNGAFLVNYVITAALIGTATELVRLPELLIYVCKVMSVRSAGERIATLQTSNWEFDFGEYYARTLCVFSVVTTYSILCPLITPFGLVYLILRHLVERHNLFFAYHPGPVDSRIHWSAINLMLFSVVLLQVNLVIFIGIRVNIVSQAMSIVAVSALFFTVLFWLATMISGWWLVGSQQARHRLNKGRPASEDRWTRGAGPDDVSIHQVEPVFPFSEGAGQVQSSQADASSGQVSGDQTATTSIDESAVNREQEEDPEAWTSVGANEMNIVTSVLQRLAESAREESQRTDQATTDPDTRMDS